MVVVVARIRVALRHGPSAGRQVKAKQSSEIVAATSTNKQGKWGGERVEVREQGSASSNLNQDSLGFLLRSGLTSLPLRPLYSTNMYPSTTLQTSSQILTCLELTCVSFGRLPRHNQCLPRALGHAIHGSPPTHPLDRPWSIDADSTPSYGRLLSQHQWLTA